MNDKRENCKSSFTSRRFVPILVSAVKRDSWIETGDCDQNKPSHMSPNIESRSLITIRVLPVYQFTSAINDSSHTLLIRLVLFSVELTLGERH